MPKSRTRKKSNPKKRRKRSRLPEPYTPVKMILKEVQSPLAQLSTEERRAQMQRIGRESQKVFNETYPKVADWFVEYDAVYLLSFCAVYFLTSFEGVDREAIDGKLDFYPNYLEILQAFSLTLPRSGSGRPLLADAGRLREMMDTVTNAAQLRSYDVPNGLSQKEYQKRFVLFLLQSQTAALRNLAYSHQSRQLTKKLFDRIVPLMEESFGVEPAKLIAALELLDEEVETRLNTHLFEKLGSFLAAKTYREVWEKYKEAFPDIQGGLQEAARLFEMADKSVQSMKEMLVVHSDLRLGDIFTISLDDFARWYGDPSKKDVLRKILDMWSYEFEDLEGRNTEHFILDNPVLKRPFVRVLDDAYFFPLALISGHLLPIMMEELVRSISKETVARYGKARSRLLEDEVERLFKKRFTDCGIFRGTKWTDPESGKLYENDLLVLIDRFAIVIECKAGFVDPPARRGAEYRVVDTLQSLVVDPATQAKRFAKALSDNRKEHRLKSARRKVIMIDNTDVEYYVPVSVTYDDLGMVSANLRTCMDGGLIEESDSLVPSLSVSDLEVIFEILENEIEVLHYLMRRAELEAQIRYLGDEGDLLAFYLDSGFNLGDLESSSTHSFNLVLKSKELDPYFTAKARGKKVEKPRRKLTKWWRDIINFILTRRPQYWSEIGYLLLNVQFEEQRDFERKVKNMSSRVKHGLSELPHGWVILKTAPQDRSYLIVGYPYPGQSRKERDVNLKSIIQSVPPDEGVLGVVCIGISVSRPEYPYNVLAYAPRSLINEKTREITKDASEPSNSEIK